jgi:adenylosuccinate synthase
VCSSDLIILVCDESYIKNKNVIFEGAQGILLDQDFGFFPNVTPSNTTSKNVIEIIGEDDDHLDIYYVTRSYQTRHGNGFMSNETPLLLKNNEKETNRSHEFQGNFRIGKLDIDLLNYSLECDSYFSKHANRHLVITCIDQYPIDIDDLISKLNVDFKSVLFSIGDSFTDIRYYKDGFAQYYKEDYENIFSKIQ